MSYCTFREKHYQKQICLKIYKAREARKYCDVILQSGEVKVTAHKLILTSFSDFFETLFQDHSSQELFIIDDISSEILETIVQFAYSGEIKITEHNSMDLYEAAVLLKVDGMKKATVNFMKRHVHVDFDNLVKVSTFACTLGLLQQQKAVCSFITKNFEDVKKKGLFNSLSVDQLKTLLSNENLSVLIFDIPAENVELELLKVVLEYISNKGDDQIEKLNVDSLLYSIKFTEIPFHDVVETLENYTAVYDSDTIRTVLLYIQYPKNQSIDQLLPKKWSEVRKFSGHWRNMEYHYDYHGHNWTRDFEFVDDRASEIRIFVSRCLCSTFEKMKARTRINKIVVTCRSGKGLSVIHEDSKEKTCSKKCSDIELSEERFKLQRNEVIVKVESFYNTTDMGLRFTSNFGNVFGPYGSGFAEDTAGIKIDKPGSKRGYFYSFCGTVLTKTNYPNCLWVGVKLRSRSPSPEECNDRDEHDSWGNDSYEDQSYSDHDSIDKYINLEDEFYDSPGYYQESD
ncbi:KLHL1_4_5 [Mytilus coruscus]|uniref:KLHL1_4_5 n=1 Tax=Mytilus coruscus TaxID=42192 RepID=A0A6J8A7W5_MYTCO|nr:KLHL1_4_5 [Mytilus coruscus]